jgi:hypothetical protein
MAKCHFCGAQTRLHVGEKVICPTCDDNRSSIGLLHQRMTEAKAQHSTLSAQRDELNRQATSAGAVSHSGALPAIEDLGARTRAAFREYYGALTAYLDALEKQERAIDRNEEQPVIGGHLLSGGSSGPGRQGAHR